MILASRAEFRDSEEFRDRFLESLTPGVIPRGSFIQWDAIEKKIGLYQKFLSFYGNLTSFTDPELKVELRDSLIANDAPFYPIEVAFELLAHTGDRFVTSTDFLDFKNLAAGEIDEKTIEKIADLLVDLGLSKIIRTELTDYFLGVQVGLETHRRKNIGGAAFKAIVKQELDNIAQSLVRQGFRFALRDEEKVIYDDGKTSKTADFCLSNAEMKFGIEVNFYTSSGSKPTEIKRSYGQVNRQMEKVNTVLVWVTDGIGYLDMKKSLKEARDIHKNIYNLSMFKENFETDIITALRKTVPDTP